MLKTAITEKRNFTEMTTIPTMYNQQQVSGASSIPSVVLNVQTLLRFTSVQDIEECMEVVWTEFNVTEVIHEKDQ
ncbi:hypothetical protein T10_11417 [Trichinella papuae]|uniref:Uncharacterized protein n=1 Tax=Trichinella papuae TaxID=268474 RepID=A0A0V1N8E8_9BILA|nr:hypothetical protein T10_10300 [Trichinella papuae]KRZ80112.1 hypothetical protein T10_11417 [Trichinella papuae]